MYGTGFNSKIVEWWQRPLCSQLQTMINFSLKSKRADSIRRNVEFIKVMQLGSNVPQARPPGTEKRVDIVSTKMDNKDK